MNSLAAAAPGTAQTWIPAVASALATIVVGWLVYRNAQRANKTSDQSSLSAQQLAWTQQAMTEASAAKVEAREATLAASAAERAAKTATDAAESATRRADAAESRLNDVGELAERLIEWIARVVRKAHAERIGDNASPEVRELLRVINGGPPEVSQSRLRHRP